MKTPVKVLWHWLSMGPYHFARMTALSKCSDLDLTVVETTNRGAHSWVRKEENYAYRQITLIKGAWSRWNADLVRAHLREVLWNVRPEVVITPGYFAPQLCSVPWEYAAENPQTRVLLWSESNAWDNRRICWREMLKGILVKAFDGAVAAGHSHARYLERLGMGPDRIAVVGDCVDNEFFRSRADALRDLRNATEARYFLYVGRFVPQKNLPRLLEAFRRYRLRAGSNAWELVLVGSGPGEPELRRQVSRDAISGVCFQGFCQLDDLTKYYALAGCFILFSTTEPWGLVVNEAMASRLPVVVSSRCGCIPDLVRDRENGFVVDPMDVDGLAAKMLAISSGGYDLHRMGECGEEAVRRVSLTRFAERTSDHVHRVCAFPNRPIKNLRQLLAGTVTAMVACQRRLRVLRRGTNIMSPQGTD